LADPKRQTKIVTARNPTGAKLVLSFVAKARRVVDRFIQAAKEASTAAKRREEAASDLVKLTGLEFRRQARRDYRGTVLCCGSDGSAEVIRQHRYSEISASEKRRLAELAGKHYRRFFRVRRSVALKPEFASDREALRVVQSAMGGIENFKAMFDVRTWIEPTKAFTEERHKVLGASVNRDLNEIVEQSAPRVVVGSWPKKGD